MEIYDALGVRKVLNADGNRTLLGGSKISSAVKKLMDEADEYVDMGELSNILGERIAEILSVPAVLVTSGCSAALATAAAACITKDNIELIERIPDTNGLPNEILIQRNLRTRYDRNISISGAKLIEIGDESGCTPDQLERSIGERTVAVHYLAPGNKEGILPIEEVVRISHRKDIPVIVDAAGEVYPTSLLSKYVNMGCDLVAYGAKYFGAVNSSGILTGRKDLVFAARQNSFIGFESDGISSFGRPMKIDRQEMISVYVALNEWLSTNHEKRIDSYRIRADSIANEIGKLRGVNYSYSQEKGYIEGLSMELDPTIFKISPEQISDQLKSGNPSIWIRMGGPDNKQVNEHSIAVRVSTLSEGDELLIAHKIKQILLENL